jgi:hypothetical protein
MGFPIACSISQALADEKPVTAAEIRARARALLSRQEDPHGYADFKNHRLGGPMREEDSPGNFNLREDGDELEFAGYMRRGRRMGNGTWRGIR